jgi:hypothetical protein
LFASQGPHVSDGFRPIAPSNLVDESYLDSQQQEELSLGFDLSKLTINT